MEKKLTIIQQNDTHGCLEMHDELFWTGKGPMLKKAGSFAKIQAYVKQWKKREENVLFFDGGDLFHGSLPLVSSKGEAIIPLLKLIELDVFVPGNWDYAYGKEQLIQLTNQLPYPTVACNVIDEKTGKSLFEPYVIKELQGIKVGVIGLTYPYVDVTMEPSFAKGLSFSIGVEEVKASVEKLNGKVDVIIVLSHMGLPLDVKLAGLVNGIHVILSGHSHDRVVKPINVQDTIIVQAGSNASFLGKMELKIDNCKITDFQYELIHIDEQMQDDDTVNNIVEKIMSAFTEERNVIVGDTLSLLHRMTLNEAPMDKLITDAYLYHYHADVAFSHGWRYGPPIRQGPITMYDLYSVIPTNPEIFTVEVEGYKLKQMLEKNLEQVFSMDPFQQKGGYIMRSSNLFMTFKPYNPKYCRIQELHIGGNPLIPNKIYQVVGASKQLLKGLESNKKYESVRAIDAIQAFLKEQGPYKVADSQDIISV